MKTSGNTFTKGADPRFRTSVTPWDIGILCVLILLSLSGLFAFHLFHRRADTVWISANGRVVGYYPLSEDREIRVRGSIGTTIIRIHKGQASIIKAPCAHKFCRKMGPIPAHGNVMICIPNRIIVEIRGRKKGEIDAITR